MDKIVICSAMILRPQGELLVVRKKSSQFFQLPGGKMAPGEDNEHALARELMEELRFDISGTRVSFIGTHVTKAVNEADTLVEGHIYCIQLDHSLFFTPYEELEEVLWLKPSNWQNYKIAHLAAEFVIPRWLSGIQHK